MQLLLGEGMLSFLYADLPVGKTVRVWWDDYENDSIDVARVAGSAESCDLFLCLSRHALPFAAELALRMGASWTVGYSEIFDIQMLIGDDVHEFDQLFAIPLYLEPLLRFDQFSAPPVFSAAAEAAAARYISSNCRCWDRVLFLHPETLPEKTWAPERFAWVLEHFLAERPEYIVVVSSLAPTDFGSLDGRVIQTDVHLELALALMRYVDLFLGIDSCFLHAADLFRIPGVALFGPTASRQFGFRLSPWARHIAEESMDKIRPGPVLEALLELAELVESKSIPAQRSDSGAKR
jgi:hypothetical protein